MLAACKDVGLKDRNLPYAEARYREPHPLVASVHQERARAEAEASAAADSGAIPIDHPVPLAGRLYQVSGTAQQVGSDQLTSAGSFRGRQLMAFSWDEPPYDRLYMATGNDGEYLELEPLMDSGPARTPHLAEGEVVVGEHGSAGGAHGAVTREGAHGAMEGDGAAVAH